MKNNAKKTTLYVFQTQAKKIYILPIFIRFRLFDVCLPSSFLPSFFCILPLSRAPIALELRRAIARWGGEGALADSNLLRFLSSSFLVLAISFSGEKKTCL